jgi:hypothetical protein
MGVQVPLLAQQNPLETRGFLLSGPFLSSGFRSFARSIRCGRNQSGTWRLRIPARDFAEVIRRIRPLSSISFACRFRTSPDRSPKTKGMQAATAACLTMGSELVACTRHVAKYFLLSSSVSFAFPQRLLPSPFTSTRSSVSVQSNSFAFRQKDFASANSVEPGVYSQARKGLVEILGSLRR